MFACFFDELKMSGGYLLYSSPNLLYTYIKRSTESDQKVIGDLVKKVMQTKNENQSKDTSDIESHINKQLYKFYNLTER